MLPERAREGMEPSTSLDREGRDADAGEASDAGGRRAALGRRLNRLFSLRAFLFALALSTAGIFLGGFASTLLPLPVPFLGIAGRFVGLFAAAFAVGLVAAERRYLEAGSAGAVAAAFSFLLAALGSVFVRWLPVATDGLSRYGTTVAGVGAGSGLLVALAGYYFGRDLRDGLTRDVE